MSMLSVCLLLTLNVQTAVSWDCGPSGANGSRDCMHDVCSGGVQVSAITFLDAGGTKRELNQKLRGNTHLWVVRNALELLDKGQGSNAETKKIYAALEVPACKTAMEAALFDADEGQKAETGGALGTHFYNASGKDIEGKAGAPERYTGSTFLLFAPGNTFNPLKVNMSLKNGLGNARDNEWASLHDLETKVHISATGKPSELDARLKGFSSDPSACGDLGYALHYLTDMTQPMHSSSFSAVSKVYAEGRVLHGAFEYWVPDIQAQFPAKLNRSTNLGNIAMVTGQTADDIFVKTSIFFNSRGPELYKLLKRPRQPGANGAKGCTIDAKNGDLLNYSGPCFLLDPVDPALVQNVGEILDDAYIAAASFIYTALYNGPGLQPK